MYERSFHLEIVSPTRVAYSGEAASLIAPGVLGMFQVLVDHAPMLAQLAPGPLTVKDASGVDHLFAVGGGVTEVRDNTVIVLADSAEPAAEIDVARAENARAESQRRVREAATDDEKTLAAEALARARNRLKVAQKT